TIKLLPILLNLAAQEGTTKLCFELLMPAQRTFSEMERHGILVDPDYVAELRAEWYPKLQAVEEELQEFARNQGFRASEVIQTKDDTMNPGSPKQLAHFLFNILGLQRIKGNSTDAAV